MAFFLNLVCNDVNFVLFSFITENMEEDSWSQKNWEDLLLKVID